MRELFKLTAAGLVVALAAAPAVAQTNTRPQNQQQAPRDQYKSGGSTAGTGAQSPNQQGSSSTGNPSGVTDNSNTTGSGTTGSGSSGTMGSGTTGSGSGTTGTMSRDSGSSSGTMSRDNASSPGMMRGQKAGKANVRQVQEALKAQGHDPGPIDGMMGPQTQQALRDYQRSQNLTETGRLDQQTAEKLGVGGSMSQGQSR